MTFDDTVASISFAVWFMICIIIMIVTLLDDIGLMDSQRAARVTKRLIDLLIIPSLFAIAAYSAGGHFWTV
jgi:hypothetical protein